MKASQNNCEREKIERQNERQRALIYINVSFLFPVVIAVVVIYFLFFRLRSLRLGRHTSGPISCEPIGSDRRGKASFLCRSERRLFRRERKQEREREITGRDIGGCVIKHT